MSPADYDTTLLANTTIDVNSAGRQWTYQYCTEYGFYQTPSEIHPMRSRLLDPEYWPKMCDRAFEGLTSKKKARAFSTWADQGGWNTQGTNIFFTNGSEDPWQVATQEKNRDFLGQISEFATCDTCGHCGDFHTPSESTPESMVVLQSHIADWLNVILGPKKEDKFLQ